MPVALKAAWEVTAGMIPGQPDQTLSRRWDFVSGEDEKYPGPPDLHPITQKQFEATAYVHELQNLCVAGRTCNWVRLDFVWM